MSEPRGGYEPFDCAPALRLEAHERVTQLRFEGISERLDRIEALIERLERRVWIAVYGVAAAVLADVFLKFVQVAP
ncbi:MAG: GTA head formation protein, RCAP_rcc01685 family [Marivita sp.]|uniref:GTA head formation protein, RCAP_rcc01685 family n=1 Tax=Marivita sp. TaxID=2003365 RepID=UPI003EF0EA72